MKEKLSFWVSNISGRNVSLTDLNLTIKAYNSVNLLDTRHYHYTLEQLQKSEKEGSLYKKRQLVVVRKVAPTQIKEKIIFSQESYLPSRSKSIYDLKEEKFEELNISDEEFADANAELAEMDRQKIMK